MLRILVSRLMQTIPVLILVSIVVFSITMLLPGDPAYTVLGDFATDEQRQQISEQYGFDQPIPVQYVKWGERVLTGDFGRSIRTKEPVLDLLMQRLPVTVELAILSILIAIAVGIPLGVVAAIKHNTFVDTATSFLAMASLAIPNFWAGILLIILFTMVLGWLPPSGYVPFLEDPIENLRLMIMPSLTLGTALAALIMRQTRASMLNALGQDYVRTANAKGLSEIRILTRHVLRNALIPVTTVVGLQIGKILGGAVIVESIFSMPGMGRLVVESIFSRDFPVIQISVLLIVVLIIIVNLAVDLIYTLLDPRIKL